MVTITLDLPADVEDKAQKQGLLSPAAFELFIRKSLAKKDRYVCPECGKNEHIPNASTIAALKEGGAMLRGEIPANRFRSLEELFEVLDN